VVGRRARRPPLYRGGVGGQVGFTDFEKGEKGCWGIVGCVVKFVGDRTGQEKKREIEERSPVREQAISIKRQRRCLAKGKLVASSGQRTPRRTYVVSVNRR